MVVPVVDGDAAREVYAHVLRGGRIVADDRAVEAMLASEECGSGDDDGGRVAHTHESVAQSGCEAPGRV